jgi:hypothetical protein
MSRRCYPELRLAAEDLRDAAAKLAAAVIAGRLEDAAYTLNAAVRDCLFDVERQMGLALLAQRREILK